jgi:hypothetical protein
MARKRYKPEEIVAKLRQVDVSRFESFSSPAIAGLTDGSSRQLVSWAGNEMALASSRSARAGFPRQRFVELGAHYAERGPRHRVVEPQHGFQIARQVVL